MNLKAQRCLATRAWENGSHKDGWREKGAVHHHLRWGPGNTLSTFTSASMQWVVFVFFFFLGLFCLFRTAPTAHGGSQARGLIRAIATGLHHSHSNVRSELRL